MQVLNDHLKTHPTTYVSRDIERALGLPLDTPGYFIIANSSRFANRVATGKKNVLLIDEGRLLDTHELIAHPQTQSWLSSLRNVSLVVFKNTGLIERICDAHGYRLLNPPAKLANTIEEKISQIAWLGPLTKYLPPHQVALCKDTVWHNEKFILQFNHAHTGGGTYLITAEHELQALQDQFPNREVRIVEYIEGPVFTNNNVVTDTRTLLGNINYQITGLPPFTDRLFATIGNDWGLAEHMLSGPQRMYYEEIVTALGHKLKSDGWRGLFGVDMIVDEKNGQVYLLEINARQPASTTYESQLQQNHKPSTSHSLTTFEAHLAALLRLNIGESGLIPIHDGAQLIIRNQPQMHSIPQDTLVKRLHDKGLTCIVYDTIEPGTEWLRIQSPTSLLKDNGVLNETGQYIAHSTL